MTPKDQILERFRRLIKEEYVDATCPIAEVSVPLRWLEAASIKIERKGAPLIRPEGLEIIDLAEKNRRLVDCPQPSAKEVAE